MTDVRTKADGALERRGRRWVIPLFLGLGFCFLTLGTVFFLRVGGRAWGEIVYIVGFEAAIIFFTAAIIERLLLKEFGDRTVEVTRELLDANLELVRNAWYNGVVNILPARRDASVEANGRRRCELTYQRIREALDRSKTVRILCVSGRQFLWPRLHLGFYDVLRAKAERDAECDVRVLLADVGDGGYGAAIRGSRERPRRPTYIANDVATSVRGRDDMTEDPGTAASAIKLRYYNFLPQAWLVITDDFLFLEPYHMADAKYLKDTWNDRFRDNDPSCGGRLPIIMGRRDSVLYDAMLNYFDWIWAHKDPNVFSPDYKQYINVVDDPQARLEAIPGDLRSALEPYRVSRPWEVVEFLQGHPSVVKPLQDAASEIRCHFEGETELSVQVVWDQDAPERSRLEVSVRTNLPHDQALESLERLNQRWWASTPTNFRKAVYADVEL